MVPVTSVSLLKVLGEDAESPEAVAEIFSIKRNYVDQIKSRMIARLKDLWEGAC